MKARIIKAVISKKHKDFLDSIEDLEIRKIFENNAIVTGGAIVSMLLNEKVSDFDYYLTDYDSCKKVAKYYVGRFNRENKGGHIATVTDGYNKQDFFDDRVKIYVQSLGVSGFLDNQEQSEAIELSGLNELAKPEQEEITKYRPVFLSTNAITLSSKIQIVIRFYGEPEQIHDNYDYIHCTCWWRAKDGHLELPAKALEAILTRELVYSGSKYPLCSIFRARKFIKRGWTINAGQFLKMALQLNEMDLLDVDVLQDQLTGVDSAYFEQVIENIRKRKEEDPNFKFDTQYLIHIINKIF